MTLGYSTPFDRALQLATIVHEPERRKGTAFPYVMHPFHVAVILLKHGLGEPAVLAAVLHDVLEDVDPRSGGTRTKLIETFRDLEGAPHDKEGFRDRLDRFIEQAFGREVAVLVRGVTNAETLDGHALSSEEKHARKIRELLRAETPIGVLALKAADVIHNTRSTANDLAAIGATVMDRFNASPRRKLQWYQDVAEAIRPRLETAFPALAIELRESVAMLVDTLSRHVGQWPDEASTGVGTRDR